MNTETEPAGTTALTVVGKVQATNVSWEFINTPIQPGTESAGIFRFVAMRPPVYGTANIQNDFQFSSLNPGGQGVPVPDRF